MTKKLLLCFLLTLPSFSQEEVKIDLPALIAQADRYKLPKPPEGAQLILANTGYTTTAANRSSDLDPAIYEPGFLLKKKPDNSVLVLTGFIRTTAEPRRKHQPAVRPFSATPTKPKPGSYVFRGNSQSTFCTAIQCARLGDLKTARTLLQNYYKSEYIDTELDAKRDQLLPQNAHLLLALTTFDYHYQHLRKKDADPKQSLAILEKLQTEFPDLFPDDEKDYYSYQRTLFLKDLRITANSPPRKKDSIEDLIHQAALSDVPSHMRKPDHPYFKIYHQGTAVIPELVRLSTSRKLTPAIQPAIMNSREKRLRLGHLAAAILEDMCGALAPGEAPGGSFRFHTLDERWIPWIKKTDLTGEKSFFLKALGNPEKEQDHNTQIPLSILLHRHPDSTLELAGKYSKSKRPNNFIPVLMSTNLEKETKIKALKTVARNRKNLERRTMLQALARLSPDEVAKEIIPIIKSLPKDVSKPYWTVEEANLTHVVMQLDDPKVWKAYLAKAKTCSVGLRMEFMNPMNYTYIGEKNQNLRLAFLAAFLNDTEVRTVKPNDPRWEGPHAGFTYDKLSVQNFVSEKIASILEIPGEPADHWTEKEWTPFRKSVVEAVSALTLPDLS